MLKVLHCLLASFEAKIMRTCNGIIKIYYDKLEGVGYQGCSKMEEVPCCVQHKLESTGEYQERLGRITQ